MSLCTPRPKAAPHASSFYMRPLPDAAEPFASARGRTFFREALLEGTMEGYFKLAQQFHTQSEPAYCGLGSLVCVLNALSVDPGRSWKGAWRWFSEELLDCCKSFEEIRRSGLTLDEVACLARCAGAGAQIHRPGPGGMEVLRAHVIAAASNAEGPMLVVNYSRRAVGQTGSGHFSPIGGYHAASDRALVLDTARFKYPPHWLALESLFRAMEDADGHTGRPRGWLTLERQPR